MIVSIAVEAVQWVLYLAGSFFLVTGGIGVLRMRSLFTRTHAASVTDTGAMLVLLGLTLESGVSLIAVKLLMILFLMIVTNPTSAHALMQAALARGIEPEVQKKGEL